MNVKHVYPHVAFERKGGGGRVVGEGTLKRICEITFKS